MVSGWDRFVLLGAAERRSVDRGGTDSLHL